MTKFPQLTDQERWSVINGLRVAAEVFLGDAINARNSIIADPDQRLSRQFLGQAAEAKRLADMFEALP